MKSVHHRQYIYTLHKGPYFRRTVDLCHLAIVCFSGFEGVISLFQCTVNVFIAIRSPEWHVVD